MRLLPKPQIVNIKEGFLKTKTLCVKNFCTDIRIEKALTFFEQNNQGADLVISCSEGKSEKYALDIEECKITISAQSSAGVFYSIQTLKQLFENDVVPCLHIEDNPDMGYRGFYHDVTRGKVPTVETLKRLVDILAYYKMNSLQIYVEHTFPFKEFGDSVEKFGYLTADEIKEIDNYCYDNFIEFIPSIATFGHLYELLQIEENHDLCTAENYKAENVFWFERMKHHTIDPKNPKSFAIIKSLIDQYMPLFRTDKFNICCDETFDLKSGKYKDEDTGKLYVNFVIRIVDYLKSKGKKVMMWSDIVLKHPETINRLPSDIHFLNWNYSPEPNEDSFAFFENSGFKQIACPGTGTWNRLVESIDESGKNICKMLDFGYKHGALGMLNTNWGDYGNPCSLELSMYGTILGAAKAWNKETKTDEYFENSINFLHYKSENAVKYLSILDNISKKITWRMLVFCYSNFSYSSSFEIKYPDEETIKNSVSICRALIEEANPRVWENEAFYSELLVSAEGLIVMAELFAKLAGYNTEKSVAVSQWLTKYRKNWTKVNKESELKEIEKMFVFIEELN